MQPLEAVQDHVERELELDIVIAPTESPVVGGRRRKREVVFKEQEV